ncbi:hypothetical protein HanIR_Chr11g0557391 [Helianthus annuus]|nr:hypothetical protein HanIR_Chr11g0557391 [Helianthus annuus]
MVSDGKNDWISNQSQVPCTPSRLSTIGPILASTFNVEVYHVRCMGFCDPIHCNHVEAHH